MAREGRLSEKGRRDRRRSRDLADDERKRDGSSEKGEEGDACARGVVTVAVADVVVVVVVILLVAVPLVVVCAREKVDGHYYPTEHPIPSYPPGAILS